MNQTGNRDEMRRLAPIALADEAATIQLGCDLAAALRAGDVLALRGDLGMGKSTLARAIIRALAAEDDLDVPSPTFTLVQAYDARIRVHHVDLYRLGHPDELDELGLDEAIAEGVVLVEWPERAGDRLPADAIEIELGEAGAGRVARVAGPAERVKRINRSLRIRAFLTRAGAGAARRRHLMGDASARAYETVELPDGPIRILMNAPRQPDGPPIRDGLPYSRIAHLAESVVPFVAIDKALRSAGFAAPRIDAQDLDDGLLLIEHLGSQGLLDGQGRPIAERYLAAARLLAAIHDRDWPDQVPVEAGRTYGIPRYDRAAMAIETELLTDWYLPYVMGGAPAHETVARYRALWSGAFDALDAAETSLVLRDYHSPNLIWRPERSGHDRLGIIDFQDALIGPAAYDLASLAMDARVTIEPPLEAAIKNAYRQARARPDFDAGAFEDAYAIMAAQRNSKIIGIFVRLDRRDGKPAYLKHLPRIRDYLRRALAAPVLAPMAAFYREAGVLAEPGS